MPRHEFGFLARQGTGPTPCARRDCTPPGATALGSDRGRPRKGPLRETGSRTNAVRLFPQIGRASRQTVGPSRGGTEITVPFLRQSLTLSFSSTVGIDGIAPTVPGGAPSLTVEGDWVIVKTLSSCAKGPTHTHPQTIT